MTTMNVVCQWCGLPAQGTYTYWNEKPQCADPFRCARRTERSMNKENGVSAWAFLVSNFARTPEEQQVFSEALEEIQREERHRCAARQKHFFGDIFAQGNDWNWYHVSDWLTRHPAGQEEETNDAT